MSTGAISQIFAGRICPIQRNIDLLKLLVAQEVPAALEFTEREYEAGLEPWERSLVGTLRALTPADRNRVLNALRAMTDGLPRPSADAAASRLLYSEAEKIRKAENRGKSK